MELLKDIFTEFGYFFIRNFKRIICQIIGHNWDYDERKSHRQCKRCPRNETRVYHKFGKTRFGWEDTTIKDL